MNVIYKGEVQLANWSDTSNGGAKIVLWLPDGEALANFKSLTARKGGTAGQILACMVTTVDEADAVPDDQMPNEPEPLKGGPLAKLAGRLIRMPEFWTFQNETYFAPDPITCSESSDDSLKAVCWIGSKRELDHDKAAANRFHDLIRKPWEQWNQNQGE